eukprot:4023341-Amphidinium_carterae.1
MSDMTFSQADQVFTETPTELNTGIKKGRNTDKIADTFFPRVRRLRAHPFLNHCVCMYGRHVLRSRAISDRKGTERQGWVWEFRESPTSATPIGTRSGGWR